MKPDRSNYEIWIIDWLDGKLDAGAEALLISFLEANSDLKEEAEFLSMNRLKTGSSLFTGKSDLKRSASDLPLSQVEYLSVAWLENDLTTEQKADLAQSLNANKANKEAFDNIQKIRLAAPEVIFKNKSLLKKQTREAAVFRLASAVLAAAAVITILITGILFLQKYLPGKTSDSELIASSQYSGPPIELTTGGYRESLARPITMNESADSEAIEVNKLPAVSTVEIVPDVVRPFFEGISGIPVEIVPELGPSIRTQYLASTNNIFSPFPEDYYDRSRVRRFIARNFREKILRDTLPSEAPLKSYEIAEAGIAGLNKLLGWNMALVTTNDDQGDVRSLYFSSRMLKFNAPVKKSEPLP